MNETSFVLDKTESARGKFVIEKRIFTCATELVPLVGKVTVLFYTDSWYCMRLQL